MIRQFMKPALGMAAALMVLTFSCKKADNNPNNNNNSGNSNSDAPSLSVLQPAQDTSVQVNTNFTVKIIAHASSNANIDSVTRVDNIGHHIRLVSKGLQNGGTVSYTKDTIEYDVFQLPNNLNVGQNLKFVYTVYGKGKSNTITRNIKIIGAPPVFGYYTVIIGDQTNGGNGAFLNTGGNPLPLIYSTGDVNQDTTKRSHVDMCCAKTAGQTDMIFSPGYVVDAGSSKTFADSNIFNINLGWTPASRRITLFKKIAASQLVNKTNFPDYTHVVNAYKNASSGANARVWFIFSPGDNYAFQTYDGRYGVLSVTAIGGGVKMDMAFISR